MALTVFVIYLLAILAIGMVAFAHSRDEHDDFLLAC